MNRLDAQDILVAQIRGLQSIYPEAHAALVNWGRYSLDRRGIFPGDIKPPATFDQYRASDYDEVPLQKDIEPPASGPVKSEGPEYQPYDEKAAIVLCERIHSGMLNEDVCLVIKTAYVSHDTPEYQWPTFCGCSDDAFRERLETALLFVSRFT